jgi:hypothetical protein
MELSAAPPVGSAARQGWRDGAYRIYAYHYGRTRRFRGGSQGHLDHLA